MAPHTAYETVIRRLHSAFLNSIHLTLINFHVRQCCYEYFKEKIVSYW